MIEVDYELGKKVVETCRCDCGAALSLPWGGSWGIQSYVLKCGADPSHDRVVPLKSFYRMWKDGEELPSFIKDNIERKFRRQIMEQNDVKAMVIKQDADKLSVYLQGRFPQDLVKREAALDFARWCIAHQLEPIRDCIPYHGNPFITVEWLDRQASNDEKFKGYSYNVFGQQAKESLDFDPKDIVVECQANWEGLKQPLVGLGVVTKLEREAKTTTGGEANEVTARGYRSPVVRLHPQNMVFKRARAAALKQRYHIPAPLLEELPYTTVIEAEYKIKDTPKSVEEPSDQGAKKPGAASPTKTRAKQNWPGFWAQANQLGLSQDRVHEMLEVTSMQEWVDRGKTLEEAIEVISQRLSKPEPEAAEAAEGEGFKIDLTWLKESLKTLKWTEDTCKTFLVSKYKVSPQGILTEVLKRLTREQAEEFVKEINGRLEKQAKLI